MNSKVFRPSMSIKYENVNVLEYSNFKSPFIFLALCTETKEISKMTAL